MNTKYSTRPLSALLLLAFSFLSFIDRAQGQCTVSANADPLVVSCGDQVQLSAVGNTGDIAFGDDFNDNNLDAGWSSNLNVIFSNPCGANPNGTSYAWMGSSVDQPRILTTNSYDVSCGGEVCFDLKLGDNEACGGCDDCEDPDATDEGVHFQYSTNGGGTWNTISYFDPTGPNSYFDWNNYCFTIPPAAQTANTEFRFYQDATSGNNWDHWGIDDFEIFANDCSYEYDWTHTPGSPDGPQETVTVNNDSTFTVIFSDGTDTCTSSVTVNVLFPSVSASVSSTPVCPGDNVTLDAHLTNIPPDTCCYTLDMDDSYGDGWNGGELEVFEDGTSLGTYSATGSGSIEQFCVGDGNTIELEYTAGFLESENTYTLIDPNGNTIFSDGPTPSTGTVFTTTANCGGGSTYDVNWTPTGGVTDPSDSNTTATVNSTTTYTATVTAPSNSCTSTDNVTVNVNQVTADPIITDATCGNCDGQIEVQNPAGGTSPYQYSIDGGSSFQNSNTFTGLCIGNFNVVVQDDLGCEFDTTVSVGNTPGPSDLSFNLTDETCGAANGVVEITGVTDGVAPYQYDFNGSGFSNTTVYNGLTAGTYTVTVEDDNGCIYNEDVTLSNHPGPTGMTISTTAQTCAGADGEITISGVNGGTAPYQYELNGGGFSNQTNYTGLTAGSYTVNVQDDNGCVYSENVTVPADTNSPNANVAAPATITCSNNSVTLDGSASTSGSGSIDYLWSNGLTSASISVTTGGTYTLTVTDPSNGCTDDTTVTVPTNFKEPTPLVPLPDTITCADNNVTVDASTSTSNSGSVNFAWSTGNGNITSGINGPTIDVDQGGSYHLTLTDPGNGCTHDTTVVVHVDSVAPTVNFAAPDTFYCSTTSLTLDGTPSTSNSGNKTYSWSAVSGTILSGANTATPDVGASGDYALTVTDPENGCSRTDTVTVPEDQDQPIINVAAVDTLTCTKNVVTVDASASTSASGTKDFSWSTPGGNIVNAAADSSWIDVDATGDYVLTLTDPDNGCQTTTTINVPLDTISPDASVIVPDTLTCDVNSVTLDGSPSTSSSGQVNYAWSNGDTGPTSTVNTAGNYTLTVTDPTSGCTDDTTVTVPIDTISPSAVVQPPDTLTCSANSVTLDGSASTSNSGSVDYAWSTGDNSATTTVSTPGNYSLTVTDPNSGCTHDTTVMVPIDTISPTPIVAQPDTITCTQTSVTLDASASTSNSGSVDYAWSTGDNTVTTTVSSPGNYTVTVNDPNSGCSDDTTVYVPEADKPDIVVDSINDALCYQACNGSAYISVVNGTAPYTYQWDDANNQTSQDATGLCAGDHIVTVTDDNGCTVKDTVTVGQPSEVQVDPVNDTTICIGGTATLSATASGGTPGYTYHWDQGLGTGQVQTVSPGTVTTYTVYAEDANGCSSDPVSVRVDYHPELQVSASPDDSICPGTTAQLNASGSGGIGSGYTYSWSNGMNGDSISVAPSSDQEYVVTLEDGCETPAAKDTVEVGINPLPDVQIFGRNLNGCKPVEATLVNATPDGQVGSNCLWKFGDGEQSTGCDTVTHSFDAPGCYDVSLTVSSPEGCVDSTTVSDYVCVYPYPTADFNYNPQQTTVQDPGIEFTNMSSGAESYRWNFGELDTSTAEHPSYRFPSDEGGTYDVCLKTESSYGCRDSICKDVTIDGEFILYVPNAFTPDGDGVNDKFYPVVQGADPTNYHFYVYDRWGEVVYETHHPEGKWDGSVKGSQDASKTDVYVWKLVTTNKYTGKEIVRQGHVTMIR